MLRLLWTVSWGDYRAAPGRLVLMVGGIASGVALIAALGIINRSVLSNFRVMLERAAGKAALQIELGTGEVGFDEAVVDVVVSDPDVHRAFALVRGTLHAADGSGEVLQLFGVDLGSDAIDSYDVKIHGWDGDALELLNQPDALFVTKEYAARRDVTTGDWLNFATPAGIRPLQVRGLLEAKGLATVFGGNLAVMDVAAAQALFGKQGRVDQVDVLLRPLAAVAPVQQRLGTLLPTTLSVKRPALRSERFERVISAFQAMLDGLSLLCLLAGVFIVYNTTATAIVQRARDLAILFTLGAQRRTIFALVVAEATLIGAVASAIGIALGVGLAHLLTNLVAESMGIIYQVRFPVESLGLTTDQVCTYLAIGTASAIVASLVPALKASSLDPIELMRADFRERLTVWPSDRLLMGVWAILVVAAGGAVYAEIAWRSIAWGNVAATLWWLSAVVLSIPVMGTIARSLSRLLPRFLGIGGRIAAAGLMRAPGRTGVTAAVIGYCPS